MDGTFIGHDFLRFEPKGDFLVCGFDRVASVADVTAHVLGCKNMHIGYMWGKGSGDGGWSNGEKGEWGEYNCVVAADGSGSRGERISRSKHSYNVNLIQRVRSSLGGLLRPVFTTSLPCQTMATMGPDPISTITHPPPSEDIHLTRLTVSYCLCKGDWYPGKKGFDERSASRNKRCALRGTEGRITMFFQMLLRSLDLFQGNQFKSTNQHPPSTKSDRIKNNQR